MILPVKDTFTKIVLCTTLLVMSVGQLFAADAKTTAEVCWQEGIQAYGDRDYARAVERLERVVELGYATPDTYYNLANAYFKLGQNTLSPSGRGFASGELGKAVLNYRRALRLNPAMEDARYNLDIAVDYTNDTEAIPFSFVVSLWHSLRNKATTNTWAVSSVVLFVVLLISLLVYLLSQQVLHRKVAFGVAVVALLLFVITTACSLSQRAELLENSHAVVVCSDTTPVHASPDSSSKIIRQPSQGVTLRVLRSHGEWSEILFSDGEKGWIRSSVIEEV